MTREKTEHPLCEWCNIPILPDEAGVKDEYGDRYHIGCIIEAEEEYWGD